LAGVTRTWDSHEKIPTCSLRALLTRFVDVASSPSRQFLEFLSGHCEDANEKERMDELATESAAYEDWRHSKMPHLLAVLEEFPSCKPPAPLFIAHLNPLQPRFYSISSSQRKYPNEVHLTVAVVQYKTTGELIDDDKERSKWSEKGPSASGIIRAFDEQFEEKMMKKRKGISVPKLFSPTQAWKTRQTMIWLQG
jgi:FAD binding domain